MVASSSLAPPTKIQVWLAVLSALVWSTVLPRAEAAEPGKFSFQFFNVKLGQLTRVVLSDVVKVNYVFESNFLANDDEVSLDLRGLSREESLALLFKLLDRHGYSAARTMGVVTVEKKVGKPDEEEVFFYRLRYRDLGYINDLIGALFPSGKFNFQQPGQRMLFSLEDLRPLRVVPAPSTSPRRRRRRSP